VGDYLELEYDHPNHFPGILGGGGWTENKLALKKQCEDAGIDWKAAGLSGKSGTGLWRSLLRKAQGPQTSLSLPSTKVMASAIQASSIDPPPGNLYTMERSVLEPFYLKAEAELAKTKAQSSRRAAEIEQSEETKEEDVEMQDVTQIKFGVAKDEKRLKAEVEKLLGKALEAWTCAESQ